MRRWMRAALAGALWASPAPAMTLSLPAVVTELALLEIHHSSAGLRHVEGRSFYDDDMIAIGDEFVLSLTIEGPIERVFEGTLCTPDSQTAACYRTGDQTASFALGSYAFSFSSFPVDSAGRSRLSLLDDSTLFGPEPLDAVRMDLSRPDVQSTKVDLPVSNFAPGPRLEPVGDEIDIFADRTGAALSGLDFEFPRTLLAFGEFDVLLELRCFGGTPRCVPVQELPPGETLVESQLRLVAHVVPEPATALLLAAGLAALSRRRARR